MECGRGTQNVALIAGVTGIVGASLVELLTQRPHAHAGGGPWKVYGIARRARPRWLADSALEYIQCDLLNKEQTERKLAALKDVTHLFYVTWTCADTEEDNCRANGAMLRNTTDALLAHATNLKHICLQTGIKHYVGSHFGFRAGATTQVSTYYEDLPRLREMNFYYVQEDILLDAVKNRMGRLTWSVHRPGLIFGLSPDSLVNSALALAVYASICKHEGNPLLFTGTQMTWDSHLETSDANLIAEQEIWAATSDPAKNQAFNVGNGDNVTWKELWPLIAQSFGIEEAPFTGRPTSLVKMMTGKKRVWDAIVKKHSLQPTKLEDFLNGWWVIDIVLMRLPTGRSSMQKSKEYGFHGSRDTKKSLLSWFERMRESKLVP